MLFVFTDDNKVLTSTTTVTITVRDKNDNIPTAGNGWTPRICEEPSEEQRRNASVLFVKDPDSSQFTPFIFMEEPGDDWQYFALDRRKCEVL